jgi:transcriptional regulator with GAF, ATPase, and Fis domain
MERQCLLLLDANPKRAVEIRRIAHLCGAGVRSCDGPDEARALRGAEAGGVAVCGIDSSCDAVRALKAAGFVVIGCQDGASAQPLGQQCQAFLAGCANLIDSARGDFADVLRAALLLRLKEDATRLKETSDVRTAMRAQGIVGDSKAMMSVFTSIMRIAKLGVFPVLISGESGTGKELVANAIHRLDPVRSQKPFVAVNCGAISRELAESELFGHRRGAFTGAERDRKGLFRSAEGGVLFLDEVGELSEHLQAKLLRVLQEQRVLGVGEDFETPVNVRVVAATNADLPARVRDGTFRADLHNRLNALTLHLPPLRERREDIRPLAEHFIARFFKLRGGAPMPAGADFIAALSRLGLKGNARQLENLIRWILLNKSDDEPLGLRDLPPVAWEQLCSEGHANVAVAPQPTEPDPSVLALLQANHWNMSRALEACERLIVNAALEHEHGNQSRAARLLGITPRSVYNKIRKYDPEQSHPE